MPGSNAKVCARICPLSELASRTCLVDITAITVIWKHCWPDLLERLAPAGIWPFVSLRCQRVVRLSISVAAPHTQGDVDLLIETRHGAQASFA